MSDVCDCPDMPSVWWHYPMGWERWCELDEESDPVADAAEYTRTGADAWVIMCEDCGRVYASGVGRVVVFGYGPNPN